MIKKINNQKKKTNVANKTTAKQHEDFIIYGKKNYIFIAGGFLTVLLGYILMIGGGSTDPNVFNEAIFNFQRLTLSPVIITIGFILVGIGIMLKNDVDNTQTEENVE